MHLDLKTVLLASSIIMAVGMYVPLLLRLHRRRHTRDFSKPFGVFNVLVQINNGVLAYVEHAPFLIAWYAVQTVFTSVTLWLIYHYWERPDPTISA